MGGKTCFFCLTSEPGDFNGGGGSGRGNGGGLTVLLKYLLDKKRDKFQGLIKDIVQNLGDYGVGDGGDDGGYVEICIKCKFSADRIGELDRQLEVLQMRIISELKSVKEKVLQYFEGGKGNNAEDVRETLEMFLLDRKGWEGMGLEGGKRRKLLEMICSFQMAVYEKGLEAVEVPYVLLDKYAFRHQEEKNFPKSGGCLDIVKTETVDGGIVDDNSFLDQYNDNDDSVSNFEDDSAYQPMVKSVQSVPVKNLKRKGRTAKNTAQLTIKADTDFTSSVQEGNRKCPTADPTVQQRSKTSELDLRPQNNKEKPTVKKQLRQKILPKQNELKKNVAKVGKLVKKKMGRRRLFSCELCKFHHRYAHMFEYHLLSHESELDDGSASPGFRCDLCSKSFFSKQFYTFHMDGHQGSIRFVCDVCNERIPYTDITDHVKTHTDKVFACPNCSFCSSTRDKYLIHLRSHGKGKLDCDLCSKFFYTKGKLLEHLYSEHQAVSKYVCEMEGCNKEFYDVAHLKIHENIHKNPMECQECGKVFVDTWRLRCHQRTHTGEKAFQCPECPEAFSSKANLQRHRMKNHGHAKHKCKYCDKEYTDRSMLKIHLTIHEGNGIPCGICDKVMGSKALWRRHQIVHTTEQNFICEDCGKGFTSKQGLHKHAKIHGGEKKFKCQYCDKVFLFAKYLRDHERIHTGERPFTCDKCGKSFTQSASLYLHNNKYHPTTGTSVQATSSFQGDFSNSTEQKADISILPDYCISDESMAGNSENDLLPKNE